MLLFDAVAENAGKLTDWACRLLPTAVMVPAIPPVSNKLHSPPGYRVAAQFDDKVEPVDVSCRPFTFPEPRFRKTMNGRSSIENERAGMELFGFNSAR